MSWETDLVLMTRVLVNDLGVTQKYTDEYLRRVLICAGVIVSQEISLPVAYTFDLATISISPDPIEQQDGVTQALLPLKAACILNQGQFQNAISRAIKVRDGDSSIDTSASFGGYRDILQLGPCAAYERLKWQLLATTNLGGAVLGPYREADVAGFDTVSYFYDSFAKSLAYVGRYVRY